MKIIALVGRANTGKSSLAKYLKSKYSYTELCFADALKDYVAIKYKLDRSLMNGRTDESRIWRETYNSNIMSTPRELLQKEGEYKRSINEDYWLNIIAKKIDEYSIDDDTKLVISDCRYENEVKYMKNIGATVIKLIRDDNDMKFDKEDHVDDLYCDYEDELYGLLYKIDDLLNIM